MSFIISNREKENNDIIPMLLKRISYNPDTGVLTWNNCELNQGKIRGREAGHLNKKTLYRYISLGDFKYLAHRLAWAIHYGEFPSGYIDHINGDQTDNRIKNLRDCEPTVNSRNTKINAKNTSGVNGVSWHKASGSWRAYLTLKRKYVHLGQFETKSEAQFARLAAEKAHNFSDRHGKE